ncbi:hypothetical protein [Microbacterium gorillae]|uniref:hypothetical protein n=1 Tax=Microbacterium gorillae TaxID=1231063 RepID=UPI003D96C7D6
MAGGWWLVAGGWWLVAGGWSLAAWWARGGVGLVGVGASERRSVGASWRRVAQVTAAAA